MRLLKKQVLLRLINSLSKVVLRFTKIYNTNLQFSASLMPLANFIFTYIGKAITTKTPLNSNSDLIYNIASPGSGFINSPNEDLHDNPVLYLLISIWGVHAVSIVLLVYLLLIIISKIILSLDYKLNWLDKITTNSVKIRSIILKLLKIFSKIREYNMLMLVIFLIVISLCNLYLYSGFLFNLEFMCKLYLKIISESNK